MTTSQTNSYDLREEDLNKIKALLLNKIDDLEPWYYFRIDLNNVGILNEHIYCSAEDRKKFFDGIEYRFGRYVFNGDESMKSYEFILPLVFSIINEYPRILHEVVRRIFDTNEIRNDSDAHLGTIGKFNDKNREKRNKKFHKQMRKGFRSNKDNIVIMAEGDSWFQFPKLYFGIDAVKDVLDWFIKDKRKKYAVYSLAAGGDWLSNIIYSGEYIEELPKISPDVFLISGGGNDLVGNNRLATMVVNPGIEGRRDLNLGDNGHLNDLYQMRFPNGGEGSAMYMQGLQLISDEFLSFINLIMVQYFVFIHNLRSTKKYDNMLILTHGYDYAIPSRKRNGKWISLQRAVNAFVDTGKWLYHPLSMKGITDSQDQKAVVYTMIHEFNEMLISLANYRPFVNLFHIDCRGVAGDRGWYDELHLKSKKFKEVTKMMMACIDDNRGVELTRPKSMIEESMEAVPRPMSKVYRIAK